MTSKAALYSFSHMLINTIRGISYSIEEDMRLLAKKLGISYPGMHMLWILQFEEKLTVTQLSKIGLWDISTTSRLLSNLQKKGFVAIQNREADQRIKEVSMTVKGKNLIAKIHLDDEYQPHFRIIAAIEKFKKETPDKEKFEEFMDISMNLCDSLVGKDFMVWNKTFQQKLFFYS